MGCAGCSACDAASTVPWRVERYARVMVGVPSRQGADAVERAMRVVWSCTGCPGEVMLMPSGATCVTKAGEVGLLSVDWCRR